MFQSECGTLNVEEQSGGEDPGGEDPGGEDPGGEDPTPDPGGDGPPVKVIVALLAAAGVGYYALA